jgi:tetratricopeptide (TPR) repeat protein
MTRTWCFIAVCVSAGLAAYGVSAESPVREGSSSLGDVVDADVPATYRLPPVASTTEKSAAPDANASVAPLFGAPAGPAALGIEVDRLAQTPETESLPATSPAGSPPDDSQGRAGHAAAGGVTTDTGPAQAPVVGLAPSKPIEVARRTAPAVTTAVGSNELDGAAITPVSAAYAPATNELTDQLLPAVQRGFSLARRGALYAARTEFVQVLRRIAQAHDAVQGSSRHARALAAGLRAIDESTDFVPEGVQLEAEIDVRTVVSSHRTDVLPTDLDCITPLEAVTRYHRFAQEKLQEAVAGEQSGSMALHGLGIVNAQLASENDDDLKFARNAMTMYGAALAACPNNHLAANELGVLVCRGGHADEAVALFQQAIDFAPSAVAYHNLAKAQQKLGLVAEAAANEGEAQRLAALERQRGTASRNAGVRWVSPEEMARVTQPVDRTTPSPVVSPPSQPPEKSTWQRVVDSTKSLRPGGNGNDELGPVQAERVARPMQTGPEKQLRWR